MIRPPKPSALIYAIAAPLVLWSLLLRASPTNSPAVPPASDPVLGERIAKGISFEGKLWILGTMSARNDPSGGLVSFDMRDNSRRVHFERGVLDIAKSDRDLWALSRGSKGHSFVCSVWRKTRFENIGEFQLPNEGEPIALLNNAGSPVVLSGQTVHLFTSDNHTWQVIELKGKLRSGVQVSAASPKTGGSIYIGIDVGEWGGGLQRVELKTGMVEGIERRDAKELCAGPLNQQCDPVTGVIPDPQEADCVLASVGLVHLFHSTGRILRVCGKDVTLVSELPLASKNEKWPQTEAFYGLAPAASGGFWAITPRALYSYSADGRKEKEYLLPTLESVSGIRLSRAVPGVVVLQTDVNWAVSTSGYTPLVVPLETPPAPN
jgi:hypothetical protein